ncbi:hypothetical protein [Polyangium fumosum]|uniref:Uncharacterized protein n=1 Tax=Polyangium fumosum TaxID=889272 RepID=A0A4U1JEG8_9BACT|nr:hypothetical protein [Polyangium fumosum]TKD09490.1 hypothetical protein E8A74_12250 [Polyangium fumosum]
MRSSTCSTFASFFALTLVLNCGAYGDPSDAAWESEDVEQADPSAADSDEEAVGTAEQASTTSRSDVAATLTVSSGHWGSWRQMMYCNPGTWAVGYNIRSEGSQGGGKDDDTALNSVRLHCVSKNGTSTDSVISHDGIWGEWKTPDSCTNTSTSNRTNFMKMARLRGEGPKGSAWGPFKYEDDTGATDAEFHCTNGEQLSVPGANAWGSWSDFTECPAGTAICGLSIRFEDSQGGGSGDDTAMSGLKIACCVFDGPVCGDNVCQAGENMQNCLKDCDSCGNGYCGPKETQASCMADCDICGNGTCGQKESASSCPADCDACGNGLCGPYEDICTCPEDCGTWLGFQKPICLYE